MKTPVFRPRRYNYTHQELYLGLIENKEKVIKSLRVKEHVAGPTSLEITNPQKRKYELDDCESDSDSASSISISCKRGRLDDLDDVDGIEDDKSEKRLVELEEQTSHPIVGVSVGITPIPLHQIRAQQQDAELKIQEEKRKILAKFNMLEQQYPDVKLPYVSMATDLGFMQQEYQNIVKRLKLTSKRAQYRQFLIYGFSGIEFVLGKMFKLNMEGYAASQIQSISQYDQILFELGEKHYLPDAPERFPVEVRLLGMIATQTAMFLIGQYLAKKLGGATSGTGLLNIIQGMSSSQAFSNSVQPQAQAQAQANTAEPEQPIMSGPSKP